MTKLVLVAAVTRNGAIGKGNELLVHIPEDQKRFRALTMGKPVMMGRKTWDSLPARFRPLPGRRNIVVTRNAVWSAEGAERAGSLAEALAMVAPVPEACVIGGGELYALALPHADRLELTELETELDGDAFFPPERSAFIETQRESHTTPDGLHYHFVTYERRPHA
jgi:dihydrofolate reductase